MAEPQTKASDSKRQDRPNKVQHDKEIEEINAQIKAQNEIVEGVKAKLDKMKEDKEKAAATGEKKVDPEREKLNALQAVSNAIKKERNEQMEQFKKVKTARDAARNQFDDAKKKIKDLNCNSTEEVDKKISDLEYHLATHGLNLKEEKAVIADIKILSSSKKIFAEHDALKANKDKLDAQFKEISTKLDESKAAFDKARAEADDQYKVINANKEKKETKKSEVPELLEMRNKARDEIKRLYTELKAKNDAFYTADRAWRKAADERRKEQQAKRKAEDEKYREENRLRKLKEEEEKLESLYANELTSITQLTAYLKRFIDDKEEGEEKAAVEITAPEGTVRIGKGARGFDDDIYGTKVSKAKKEGGAPKKSKGKKKLLHDLALLKDFDNVAVAAPLSSEDIPATLEALNNKKAEFLKLKEEKKTARLAEIAQLTAEVAKKQEKQKEEEAAAEEAKAEEKTESEEPATEDAPAEAAVETA